MTTYLKLDDLEAVPTAHSAGIKKVLSSGHVDLTRLTQIAWGKLDPEEKIPLHSHQDMEECFFIMKGSGRMVVNGQECSLSSGTFLIIPATAAHFLECYGDALEFFYFGLQVY